MLKKRYLFLIMIVCLFAISAVSAEEVSNETNIVLSIDDVSVNGEIAAEQENIFSNSPNNEVRTENNTEWYVNVSASYVGNGSKDNPFDTLKKALDAANDGDTIYIATGVYRGFGNTNIMIDKQVKILGNNATFDAECTNRIFEIETSNLYIYGLNFERGYLDEINPEGGAINANGNNISFINCSFWGNQCFSDHSYYLPRGGAIYWIGDNASLINCSFFDNSISFRYDKGTYLISKYLYGGAVYWYGINANVINCSFSNNFVNGYLGPSDHINTFAPSLYCYGGAIYLDGSYVSLKDCNFKFNGANSYIDLSSKLSDYSNRKGKSCSFGGAIYLDAYNVSLDNCCFINNHADSFDDGISKNKGDPYTASSYSYGGAVYLISYVGYYPGNINVNMSNCDFINNSANAYSGVSNNYDNTYRNSYVYGGAIYSNEMQGTISDCNFINNSANSHTSPNDVSVSMGNAIYASGFDSSIMNCNFTNNFPSRYCLNSSGGAVYWNVSQGVISNSIFSKNTAANGGAIFSTNDGCIISSSIFKSNNASIAGAIYCVGSKNTVSYSIFENNLVNETGGAIYWNNDSGSLSSSIFTNNVAKNGSIIDWRGFGGNILNSILVNNNPGNSYIVFANNYWLTANYNWWGNTLDDYMRKPTVSNRVDLKNWLFLNATATNNVLTVEEKTDINCDLTYLTTVNGVTSKYYAYNLIDVTLDVEYINGVGPSNVTLVEGLGKFTYTATNTSNGSVILKYQNVNQTINFIINKADFPIKMEKTSINLYDDIVVNVPFNATGLLNLEIGGKYYNTNINNGKAIFNSKDLTAGNYKATISYGGDNNYKSNSTTVSLKIKDISKKASSVSLDVVQKEDVVTFIATVTPNSASGDVKFYFNNKEYVCEINNGKASVNIYGLDSGTYTVKSFYMGDTNYKNSTSNTVSFIIDGGVKISAPEVVKYFNGPGRFVVTLTDGNNKPLPDKIVSITINGRTYNRTTDNYGVASLGLGLPSGEYDVIVECNDISVTSKVTVLPTVIANDIVKMYKNDTQYYATFLDSSGNYLAKNTQVEFYLNGIFYSREIMNNNGTAKLDINEQPGTYIITAKNVQTGENAANTINVLPNIVENYNLVKYYNESDRFSVRVLSSTGNPASGEKVKFTIQDNVYEATSNSNGYAFLNAVLQPETYAVTTSYGGLDVINTIVILPTLADKDMKVSSSDIYVGENEVIKVVLPKDATGKVSTTIDGKEYSANVNNGAANIIVSGLNYGNYDIDVIYSGDSHYNSVKNKTSFMVDKTVDLFAPDVTKYYGGPERFIVTLKDLGGIPIKNATVKITINGRTSERVTDDNGIASMGINLNSGVYITTTEYNGTKVNSTVTVKDTVIAKDFSKIFRNGTQYQGTFVDSQGNLIRNTDIEININGVFYTRKTNDNGVAQMNINLPPGTYILTATNPLSKEQHTTKVTVLPNIVENHDLTKYYKNASQYSLRLLDDKGNPVGAGVSIQLNINGVFYTRTSDANGYVKMNINLPPGTYIITAEYKGLRMSNTIKVLTVLEAKDLVMRYHDGSQFKVKVLDGQGRPYAGQTVTYNINGVFYTKTTDGDGIAALTINLPAGEYIITSMYNGLNVANKVTIIG